MADYIPAVIEIGGPLPAALLAEFIDVVRDSGAGPEYDGGNSEIDQVIAEAYTTGTTLKVMDLEASYGWFEDLEGWCDSHGLTYVRSNDGKYEVSAEIKWSSPEGKGEILGDQNANPAVYVQRLHQLLELPDADIPDALRKLVAAHIPPKVPPLTLVA